MLNNLRHYRLRDFICSAFQIPSAKTIREGRKLQALKVEAFRLLQTFMFNFP